MTIYLSKTQFTLAISKFNSHWQHQNPIFIDNIKSQFSLAISPTGNIQNPIFIGTTLSKKEPKIINAWKRKNIMVKYYHSKKPWQSSYKNSLGVILQIMFSYYKIMKCMDIICITTSIIYTFNTHGKYSNQ